MPGRANIPDLGRREQAPGPTRRSVQISPIRIGSAHLITPAPSISRRYTRAGSSGKIEKISAANLRFQRATTASARASLTNHRERQRTIPLGSTIKYGWATGLLLCCGWWDGGL